MTPDMKFSNSKTLSLLEGTSQPTGFLSSASDDGRIPVPLVGHWRANEDLVPSRPCAGSSYLLQTRSGSTRSSGSQIVYNLEDEPGRRSAAKLLTRAKTRRIAGVRHKCPAPSGT